METALFRVVAQRPKVFGTDGVNWRAETLRRKVFGSANRIRTFNPLVNRPARFETALATVHLTSGHRQSEGMCHAHAPRNEIPAFEKAGPVGLQVWRLASLLVRRVDQAPALITSCWWFAPSTPQNNLLVPFERETIGERTRDKIITTHPQGCPNALLRNFLHFGSHRRCDGQPQPRNRSCRKCRCPTRH